MPRPKLQTQRSSIVLDTTGLLSPATAPPFLAFILRSTAVVVAVALSVSLCTARCWVGKLVVRACRSEELRTAFMKLRSNRS